MVDLSLHIQDLCENCFRAKASQIRVQIIDKIEYYEITIEDNGCGINEAMKETITSPFTTSRTVRKVGLGIPLFVQTCEQTGGFVHIASRENHGTKVVGRMYKNHWDAIPLGNLVETIYLLLITNKNVKIIFQYNDFELDSSSIVEILGDVPLTEQSIMKWIKEYIAEGISTQSK